MNRPQAHTGLRTIIGLVAALGLVGALAMPALASHDTDLELVSPGANSEECEGFDYGFKLDNMDSLSAGVYTASDENHTVWIEIELFEEGNEVNDFEILDSDPAIDSIFVKQPNEGGGISHLTFCYLNEEEPTPTPTPTEEASEAPTEEPTEEPTEAPTATVNEGELGGNPTATPAGGSLPDTAVGQFGQVPATVLSLLLLGALAAMVYVRLARQR